MANLLYGSENFATTLNVAGGIDNSQTTGIILQGVSGLDSNGGILGIDWASTLDTSTYEEIEYGGYTGNELTGVTRGVNGTSAKQHSNQAVVVAVVSQSHINRINDKLKGSDTGVTLTSPVLNTGVSGTAVDTDGTLAANSDTKIPSQKAVKSYVDGAVSNTGWIPGTGTWSYGSADTPTFVINTDTDQSGSIQVGDRIKLTQTTAKYFIVTAITASTITVYGGTDYTLANTAITSPYFSKMKSPQGFPMDTTKWSVRVTNTSNNTQNTPNANTWYNTGSISLTVPIGAWLLRWQGTVAGDKISGTYAEVRATLSTTNNGESDAELTGFHYNAGATGGIAIFGTIGRSKNIIVGTKTPYYLNIETGQTGQDHIYLRGDRGTIVVEVICAYL